MTQASLPALSYLNSKGQYWDIDSVDLAAGEVIHHGQSDVARTEQHCPFRLNGDRLMIGAGKSWARMLERVGR